MWRETVAIHQFPLLLFLHSQLVIPFVTVLSPFKRYWSLARKRAPWIVVMNSMTKTRLKGFELQISFKLVLKNQNFRFGLLKKTLVSLLVVTGFLFHQYLCLFSWYLCYRCVIAVIRCVTFFKCMRHLRENLLKTVILILNLRSLWTFFALMYARLCFFISVFIPLPFHSKNLSFLNMITATCLTKPN